jgi:xylulokinase
VVELSKIDTKDTAAVGIDGQSWSAVPVDKDGMVLHNTPIWMDTRAYSICSDITDKIGFERILKKAATHLNLHILLPRFFGQKEPARNL